MMKKSQGGDGQQEDSTGGSRTSVLHVCWSGVKAQVSWHKTLRYLAQLQHSSSISAQKCFLLNGTLFLGSIVLFNVVLTPLLMTIGEKLAWLDGVAIDQASRRDNMEIVGDDEVG